MLSSKKKIDDFHIIGIKLLVFLIPFLPLYISKSIYFPYIDGKNFAFRIAIELAAAIWLVLIWFKKEYRLQNSKIMFSILVFTFIVGLADIVGVNPYNSFWSNYERMEGYITILHLLLYFFILKSILRTWRDWTIFLNLFLVAGTFAGVYAIAMPPINAPRYVMEYGARMSGTIGNPPFLASYLLLIVFIGLILITRTQKNLLKIFYAATVLINLAVIYLTASRGAILAALIGTIILCLYYISGKYDKRNERQFRKRIFAYIALLIILTVVITSITDTEFIIKDRTISRFTSIFSDKAVETRFDAWKMALHGIKERPVLGWGQENFLSLYAIVQIPYTEEHAWVDRAHNILVDWLVNAGFLGLISYLAIFGSAIAALIRAIRNRTVKEKEGVVIIIAIIVYFIQNLFTFDSINTYLVFFALLAYVDNINVTDGSARLEYNHVLREKPVIYAGMIFIALLAFVSTSYFVNYKPIRQSQITKQSSVIPSEHEAFVTLLDDFKRALSYSTFGDTYVRLQMASVANGIYARRLFEHKEALIFIQSTAEELYKGISGNRNNLMYLSYVVSFYRKIAVYEPSFVGRTEALINACLRLNPEYKWLYIELSDLYLLNKDYEGAFVAIERVTVTDPQNDVLQIKLAVAAILTKRVEVASMAVEKAKNIRTAGNNISADKRQAFSLDELYSFAQAYREVKDYSRALNCYNEMLNIMPLDAKLHYEIAEIYRLAGDIINAKKEAKKAVELASGNVDNSLIK
jgi:O-antigen ligase/tetratricopeptide (TPR) repeat protein